MNLSCYSEKLYQSPLISTLQNLVDVIMVILRDKSVAHIVCK